MRRTAEKYDEEEEKLDVVEVNPLVETFSGVPGGEKAVVLARNIGTLTCESFIKQTDVNLNMMIELLQNDSYCNDVV